MRTASLCEPRLVLLSYGHNTLFRVDGADGACHVLRIQRLGWGSVESVRWELTWLFALQQETNLVAPAPTCTSDGDLLTVIAVDGVPEPRICTLFDWMEGRSADAGLRPTHLTRVGELMALLHLHVSRFAPPEGFVRGRVYNLTERANREARSGEALERRYPCNLVDEQEVVRLVTEACSSADGEQVATDLAMIHEVQQALSYDTDVYGLIHADMHQWNYRFHRGHIRVLDFDDSGWGHHLSDMAVTLSEVKRRDRPDLREAFLAGNRSVRPLPIENESNLDMLIALRELQNLTWNLENPNKARFRDNWMPSVQTIVKDVRQLLGQPSLSLNLTTSYAKSKRQVLS